MVDVLSFDFAPRCCVECSFWLLVGLCFIISVCESSKTKQITGLALGAASASYHFSTTRPAHALSFGL